MDKGNRIKNTVTKIAGIFLLYFTGFLIGLTGSVILYFESPAFLTCNYAAGCETRTCQMDCTLEKRWGGFLPFQKENLFDVKSISSVYSVVEGLKQSDKDQHYYGIVIKHRRGDTELTPPAGDYHLIPSIDSVSKKVTDFINAGPDNKPLKIWQANWVMMLIGYGLLMIWPLQLLNIILKIRKKAVRKK